MKNSNFRTEKEKFSERFKLALKLARYETLKTSEIATKFNLLHPNEPVTQQAVHKWLNGLAIPSADKIDTLANWLKVKPEWLRYGMDEEPTLSDTDMLLMNLLGQLTEQQKLVLIDLIKIFHQEKS